ncbi:MAG: GDP-mannose 4,6-dehydratase [Bdellovibrionales bacterium]|nr:GDP-mannose 4,6-dehydratase [Bdellovibrionales bacterium]
MRVLVTGACGFVGPYLLRELGGNSQFELFASVINAASHSEVHPSGSQNRGVRLSEVTSNIIELDVTDAKLVGECFSELKPDVVCHLAGMAFAPDAAVNFGRAVSVNVGGTFNVCQALADHRPNAKLLYVSSGEVYGAISIDQLPIEESLPALPTNPYSLTKLQSEEVVRFFQRRSKVRAVIARPFNHIGPGQSEKFVVSNFAAQLARINLGLQEPVIQVGNLKAKRDFTDVRDIVAGYSALIAGNEHSWVGAEFNLCSGKAIAIEDILNKLIEISGVEVRVEKDPARMRPAEVPEVRGSYEKAKATFGWQPKYSIEESLKDVYREWSEYFHS